MKKRLFLLPFISLSILCFGFVHSQKVYCKYCGKAFDSIKGMSNSPCYKHPSQKHSAYQGVSTSSYYCLWCGKKHPSLMAMAGERCFKNPHGAAQHEPYEGNEKTLYVCEYCGKQYPSLMAMAAARCDKSPIQNRHRPLR